MPESASEATFPAVLVRLFETAASIADWPTYCLSHLYSIHHTVPLYPRPRSRSSPRSCCRYVSLVSPDASPAASLSPPADFPHCTGRMKQPPFQSRLSLATLASVSPPTAPASAACSGNNWPLQASRASSAFAAHWIESVDNHHSMHRPLSMLRAWGPCI